ncbi:MAG: hypothetical protein AB1633_08380, partial [Elusimicrobiota bacterium]
NISVGYFQVFYLIVIQKRVEKVILRIITLTPSEINSGWVPSPISGRGGKSFTIAINFDKFRNR